MSKIEDALNKIKLSRNNNLTTLKSRNSSDDSESRTKNMVVSNDKSSLMQSHTSSVKEISLMKSKELLENKELSELKIIYPDMSEHKVTDSFRDLRTKLIQKSSGRNVSVMLTSCVPGYYSSMTALNLAAAFSFDQSKTSLLIDCNLNNPQIDKKLNLTENTGLTDYLENSDVSVDSILQDSGIKRLRIISAGTTREAAAEYFTSVKMKGLMSNLISRYSDRYLFIDAAPIIDSADARILVDLCDYVILVVPYGRATVSRIKESVAAVNPDKLLGVIFTDKPAVPSFSSIFNN